MHNPTPLLSVLALPKPGHRGFHLSVVRGMPLRSSVGTSVLTSVSCQETRYTSLFQNAYSFLDPLPSPSVSAMENGEAQKRISLIKK